MEKYAIRCPNCLEWTEYNGVPSEKALSKNEVRAFLNDPDVDLGDKIHTCSSPEWICPNNFKAVVIEGDVSQYYYSDIPGEYLEPVNVFRLYKNRYDTERWTDYHGLLFSGHTILRQKHIFLHQLFDCELLRKTIRGISEQIKRPVTIYAARVFNLPRVQAVDMGLMDLDIRSDAIALWGAGENIELVCWMPVEAYEKPNDHIPVNYNSCCLAFRETVVKLLKIKRRMGELSLSRCSLLKDNKTCGEVDAPCRHGHAHSFDYNQCLKYLKERYESDPCYRSDLSIIRKLYDLWKTHQDINLELTPCEVVGFKEKVEPLIIHGHMVGVVFTGQIEEKSFVNDSLGKKDILERLNLQDNKIERIRDSNAKINLKNDLNKVKEDFQQIDNVQPILSVFSLNVKKIESLANTRYIQLRTRWEALFRKQMILWIRKNASARKKDVIKRVLKRMSEFWAFNYSLLICIDGLSNKVRFYRYLANPNDFLGDSDRETNFDFSFTGDINNRKLYSRSASIVTDNLFSDNPPYQLHPLMGTIKTFLNELDCMPNEFKEGDHLIINIPTTEKTLILPTIFVFSGRQSNQVSPLRQNDMYKGISPLCKEFTRETCLSIVRELDQLPPDS